LVEILINNQAVARAIRAGQFRDLPELMQKGRGLGMQTVDMALRSLLLKNTIGEDEALYHAIDRDSVLARGNTPVGW
jgi:twitching motility protein PilT